MAKKFYVNMNFDCRRLSATDRERIEKVETSSTFGSIPNRSQTVSGDRAVYVHIKTMSLSAGRVAQANLYYFTSGHFIPNEKLRKNLTAAAGCLRSHACLVLLVNL